MPIVDNGNSQTFTFMNQEWQITLDIIEKKTTDKAQSDQNY
jgi:hypothetical protein